MLFWRAFPLHSYLYVMANDLHKRPFGLLEELIATSHHARNRVHGLFVSDEAHMIESKNAGQVDLLRW